jgi:hypothetical protein
MGSHKLLSPDWPGSAILLISAFQIARLTGMSHRYSAVFWFFFGSTMVWTQGLALARPWAMPLVLFLTFYYDFFTALSQNHMCNKSMNKVGLWCMVWERGPTSIFSIENSSEFPVVLQHFFFLFLFWDKSHLSPRLALNLQFSCLSLPSDGTTGMWLLKTFCFWVLWI